MEQKRQELEAKRQAEIQETMRKTGIQKRLVSFLKDSGDIKSGRDAKLQVKDIVHYRKVGHGSFDEGWDLDYEFVRIDGKRVIQSLGVKPDVGFGDPESKPLTDQQFQSIKKLARFEGDDLNKIFSTYGIDRGLRKQYQDRGVDPDKANIRIEAIVKLAPELSKTQQELVAVGVMYTNSEGIRTPEAFAISPGEGFAPDVPLHPRLFNMLLDLATEFPKNREEM